MMSGLIPFQKLQFLSLYCLKNLKSILGRPCPSNISRKLKYLTALS
ncbi:hypothetical protein Pint_19167 [Pistacia integerrima]|uniref:Uncharacterized protein n=1 Tax=Pistacia integerrima TaxID=434235 RepID=A0ACC0YZ38_9ROSI|nr:hypothetical protein Pint_19167 [Pistacia integerrima]